MLKALVKLDHSQVNYITRPKRSTPLHIAAHMGHSHTVQFLLSILETEVNAQDACGNTAAHHAAFNGHYDTFMLLAKDDRFNANIRNIHT